MTEIIPSPRKFLLETLFQHNRRHVGYRADDAWEDFLAEYEALMARLVFPLRVYRGLAFEGVYSYDARCHDLPKDDDPELAILITQCRGIDFSNIGTSWTLSRQTAEAGGALEMRGECHCLLEAEISAEHLDWDVTLIQNLSVHEEEQEARLLPDLEISLLAMTPLPEGMSLPARACTGSQSWDTREAILADILG